MMNTNTTTESRKPAFKPAFKPIYAIVTFGVPGVGWQRIFTGQKALDRARAAASACKGKGSCTTARVYECSSLTLARTADISQIRDGERVVFEA